MGGTSRNGGATTEHGQLGSAEENAQVPERRADFADDGEIVKLVFAAPEVVRVDVRPCQGRHGSKAPLVRDARAAAERVVGCQHGENAPKEVAG